MKGDRARPLGGACGRGSAKDGVGHWMRQRVTAVGLGFLTVWLLCTILSLLHADYATARATLMKPWNAVLLIAFLLTMFRHAVLGLQVVIEDYVHTRWVEVASLIVIKFIAVLAALTGVLAVVRVALGS